VADTVPEGALTRFAKGFARPCANSSKTCRARLGEGRRERGCVGMAARNGMVGFAGAQGR